MFGIRLAFREGWFTPPTSLHPTPCHRAPHAGQPIHVSSASSQPGHQRGQAGHSSARGTSGSDTLWKEVSRRACSPRQHPLYLHLAPEYPAASQRGWQKKPLDGRFLRSHSQHGGEAGKALAEGGGRLQGPTPRWGCCLRKNKTWSACPLKFSSLKLRLKLGINREFTI